MKTVSAAIALSLATAAACAPTSTPAPGIAAAEPRQCFPVRSISGFNAVDDDTVNVRVGVNDVYQMDLIGPCQDIDWTLSLGVRPTAGGTFICDALDLEIITPSPVSGPQVCHVTSMRKLTPLEVAALPAGQRP